jgi:hypothetical protein
VNKSAKLGVQEGLFRTIVPKQNVASGNNISKRNTALARLQQLFLTRRQAPAPSGEDPKHRGIAITLSIVISCMLWFSFTMTEEYTVEVALPTRVENIPPDAALSELPPQTVQVELRGEGFQVFRLMYNPPPVILNAAREEINVEQALPELAKSLVVQGVNPRVIPIKVEPRITRKVPVRLRARVEAADAFDFVEPIRLTPDSVDVTGARSVVNRLAYWPTVEASFRNVKDSLVARVELADTLEGLVVKHRDFVTMTTVARLFTTDRKVLDVIPRVASHQPEVRLEPSTVTVEYRVLFSDYFEAKNAGALDFYAEVSYDSIRSATNGRVRPQVRWPAELDIRDVKVTPSTVRFYWRQN